MGNPYFYNKAGVASNAPTPADNEATSLQKINALLFTIASAGGSGAAHFDPNGNLRIFDSINNGYWTLTAPGGVQSLTNFSSNP